MDTINFAQFIFAFLFVVGLIGLMAVVLKRSDKLRQRLTQTTGQGGRLSVSEALYIDSKRKLVLVKRDGKEHLLLLTGERELVIESGIDAPMMKPETSNG